jgi:ferredoxin
VTVCEPVDEGPEADTLDDPPHPEPATFPRDHRRPTFSQSDAERKRACADGWIRENPDVGSSRQLRRCTEEDILIASNPSVISPEALQALVEALGSRGYRVLGPTVRDGAIVYDELESATELPVGWTESQDAATYRLERREDEARFGYAVGPHSWKQFLLPPRIRLWQAQRDGEGDGSLEVEEEPLDETRLAFIGVRSCELHAIGIQDRVFLGGRVVERDYAARRADTFVVAVNCFEPGGTCFCVSMGTGPKAEAGYDLALTEILDGEHRLLVEVGTDEGAEVLEELPRREAGEGDLAAASAAVAGAAEKMGRSLDASNLRDLLRRNLEHPRWDDVAERCLTCGNCTMVCPTCFCTSVEDATDLTGESAERTRVWDSCYSVDYSYIHGGSIRPTGRSRYRQWLTHKFGTWHDQFGSSGCVGCGRCITWCPVGIDVTEELTAIRATDGADGSH